VRIFGCIIVAMIGVSLVVFDILGLAMTDLLADLLNLNC
jgi:hypothetical protein